MIDARNLLTKLSRHRMFLPVLSFAVVSAVILGLVFAGSPVGFSYSTSVDSVQPGQQFDVSLMLNPNTNEVLGYDATIKYDPSLLSLESYDENGSPFGFGNITEDKTAGTLRLSKVAMTAQTDVVPVVNLHFKALAEGSAILTLTDKLEVSGSVNGELTTFTTSVQNLIISISYPPDTTAPPTPANLKVTGSTSTSVSLSWSSVDDSESGLQGYKIYYKQPGESVYLLAPSKSGNIVLAGTTSFVTSDSLTPNTPYEFAISALDNADNESSLSNPVSVTTKSVPDTTAPSAPSNLRVQDKTQTTITLAWDKSTDAESGVAKYIVYKKDSSQDTFSVLSDSVTTLQYADTSLNPGTTYEYYVKAVDNASNTSAASGTISATTDRPSTTINTSYLYYQSGVNSVEVNAQFTVVLRLNANGNSVLGVDTTVSYEPDNLQLVDFNDDGSLFGSFGDITHDNANGTVRITRLISDSNKVVTSDQPLLTLVFKALKSDVTTTLGYSGNTEVSGSVDGQVVTFPVKTTSSTIKLVAPPVQADTQPPTAPSALSATAISSSRVDLRWEASKDNTGVYKYEIQRKDAGGSFKKVHEVAGFTTSLSDTNLLAGTSYSYKVYALDKAGNKSPASNVASATTPSEPKPVPIPPPEPIEPPVIDPVPVPEPIVVPPPEETPPPPEEIIFEPPKADVELADSVKVKLVSAKSAVISVDNDDMVSAHVNYGLSASALAQSTSEKTRDSQDRLGIKLADLTPGTTYFYQVVAKDSSGSEYESVIDSVKTEGYPLRIRVLDTDGKPIKRTLVRLFSVVSEGITDDDGVVTFEDVSPGRHELVFEHAGTNVRQTVVVQDALDDTVEVASDITPQTFVLYAQPAKNKLLTYSIAGGVLLAAVALVVLGIRFVHRHQRVRLPATQGQMADPLSQVPMPSNPDPGSVFAPKDDNQNRS